MFIYRWYTVTYFRKLLFVSVSALFVRVRALSSILCSVYRWFTLIYFRKVLCVSVWALFCKGSRSYEAFLIFNADRLWAAAPAVLLVDRPGPLFIQYFKSIFRLLSVSTQRPPLPTKYQRPASPSSQVFLWPEKSTTSSADSLIAVALTLRTTSQIKEGFKRCIF